KQFVSCENSMGVVHSSEGKRTPPSEKLKSEVEIVCDLGSIMLDSSSIPWEEYKTNYDLIRDDIEKVIPGFDDYNKRVRQPSGFYLPNGARERQFNTASGKAEFTINELPENELQEGEYIMMTIRSHDQFNTTIYGLNDRYRGIFNERRVVLMNEQDMKARGFKSKTAVDLFSVYNGVKREARKFMVVPYPIPEGNVATYFPEANTLVPIDSFARGSLTPASKRVVVTIEN
ncbi:MAG: hypothetical protein HKN22_01860, partial [Bacteroidia bacterium]|nr:hypothetical protein [Bacteroidia bacterium]